MVFNVDSHFRMKNKHYTVKFCVYRFRPVVQIELRQRSFLPNLTRKKKKILGKMEVRRKRRRTQKERNNYLTTELGRGPKEGTPLRSFNRGPQNIIGQRLSIRLSFSNFNLNTLHLRIRKGRFVMFYVNHMNQTTV